MRTAIVFIGGMLLGAFLLFAIVQVGGGWYTYFILTPEECRRDFGNAITAEVVPHQPNPCHFRRPRWHF